MLSIDEINELKTRNEELEKLVELQTKQYNSLLKRYNELMNIAKNFWDKLNCGETVDKALSSFLCVTTTSE